MVRDRGISYFNNIIVLLFEYRFTLYAQCAVPKAHATRTTHRNIGCIGVRRCNNNNNITVHNNAPWEFMRAGACVGSLQYVPVPGRAQARVYVNA